MVFLRLLLKAANYLSNSWPYRSEFTLVSIPSGTKERSPPRKRSDRPPQRENNPVGVAQLKALQE